MRKPHCARPRPATSVAAPGVCWDRSKPSDGRTVSLRPGYPPPWQPCGHGGPFGWKRRFTAAAAHGWHLPLCRTDPQRY